MPKYFDMEVSLLGIEPRIWQLKIIYRMLRARTPYDETIYLCSLQAHGSPLAARLETREQRVGGP